MKNLLVTICIVLTVTLSVAQQPVQVVLLAGQSNMVGSGEYEKLDDSIKKRIESVASRVKLSISGEEPIPLSSTFSQYQEDRIGFGDVFGPEMFIGLTMAEANPDKEYLLVKTAQGGTSLYGAWNPDWDAKKADRSETKDFKKKLKLYELHQAHIEENLEKLEEAGQAYEIIGMFWMQGENDANRQFSACCYIDNLKKLISGYRKRFSKPYMPFVLGQINSRYANFLQGPDIVREAQDKVANDDPFTEIVKTSTDTTWFDFPKHPDNVHYNYEGQKRFGTAMAGKLIALQQSTFAKPQSHWGNAQRIDSGWLYLEKDSETIPTEEDAEYQKISLPHTWNAFDVLQTKDYRRDASWYRKYLSFSEDDLANRQYLRILAAGQQARVFVNGEELTHHFGGYSAFTTELSNALTVGKNQLDIWVSNANDNRLAPISADYNFYGGLYRGVELIAAPKVSICRKHYGGPGVRVWSENVSADRSDLKVSVRLDNGTSQNTKLEIVASLTDYDGNLVSNGSIKTKLLPDNISIVPVPMPDVTSPKLWSPETPELYTLKIELKQHGKTIDQIIQKHGFRWYEFTADKGFFLNGKSYKLKGINRHQDYYNQGNALHLFQHYNDISLMKEAGVNWLRLAHYQQNDYVLQLCDELGILVWEEVPWVNKTPKVPEFEENLQSMMTDLINQHFNHPAIILWGMGNEVWFGDRGDGYATTYDILKGLNETIHREDPVRKSVYVNNDNNRASEYKIVEIPDVFGYNLYRGWYGTNYNTLTDRVNELRELTPGKPLIISEFGAGSDTKVHTETPMRQDFSIEYQNDYLKSHLDQFEKIDWLSGTNWWSFADFGSAHRGDTKPHVNQKGLVTFDRQKKDVFYLLKSRYSNEPVVYLETPTWTERTGDPKKTYAVFTNMKSVELFQNGQSLGKQYSGFEWNVTLKEGENELLAIGANGNYIKEHGFMVNFKEGNANYGVNASVDTEGHPAVMAADGRPETYWKSEGLASIQIDLGHISLVNAIKIHFYYKEAISYKLEILGSSDGENWISLFDGNSNRNAEIETFMFQEQQEIRYLKVLGKGNNKNDLNSYCEIIPLVTLEKAKKNLYEELGAGEQ